MGKAEDPFYNRKPVPDAFIQDVGLTGLTPQEEYVARERKYSLKDGTDARRFEGKLTGHLWTGSNKDPFYGRKPVDLKQIQGVGETGLTPQEEWANRERKYSLKDGTDARRFSGGLFGNLWTGDPKDPYYARKGVKKPEITGVGETGNTAAEDYQIRERKQSMFQFNDDPFQLLTGRGTRQSVSNAADVEGVIATQRRRSSAMQGNAAATATAKYSGDRLAPIESRAEPGSLGASESTAAESVDGAPKPTVTHHDMATYEDPDSVAPDEKR